MTFDLTDKTPHGRGRIRNTRATARAQHVEDQPCSGGGTHRLTNVGMDTFCAGCGLSWGFLDAELREAL